MELFILIIVLIIQIAVCVKFASIAEEKGYKGSSYFWACFFLGIIGFVMVAALPDRNLYYYISDLQNARDKTPIKYSEDSPLTERSAPPPQGSWVCSCGRVNANYVSSCSCGKSKRDAK